MQGGIASSQSVDYAVRGESYGASGPGRDDGDRGSLVMIRPENVAGQAAGCRSALLCFVLFSFVEPAAAAQDSGVQVRLGATLKDVRDVKVRRNI